MSLLTNLKIGTRLIISFSIILLLLILISAMSISRISDLSSTTEEFIERDVSRVTAVSRVESEAQAAAIILLELLSTTEREDRVGLYKTIDERNKNLDLAIDQLQQLGVEEVEQLRKLRVDYHASFMETVSLLELSAEYAIDEFKSNTRPKLELLLKTIHDVVKRQTNAMQYQVNQATDDNASAMTIVIIISLLAAGLSIVLAALVSKSIVTPLKQTVSLAREIARGNIKQPDTLNGKDELVDLNSAFIEMCIGLQELIHSIQQSSTEISQSSIDLQEPVSLVKSGSEQQHQAVAEIESVVGHFAEQSEQAVSFTQESIAQANEARKLSGEGRELIHKTTQEFDVISGTIDSSVQLVESLRDHAKSVSNMVNSVREIADQTNLLALNAAIEAARAGESGRGFSVVADEVRNLAVRASEATNQIDEVIETIMSGTQSAADRIGVGREELQDGVTLLNQMVEPLTELSESAKISVNQLESLQSAVMSQARDSQHITQQIGTIATMARENQNAVSGVSQATSTMSDLSGSLAIQMERFKLD